ncbi:MAG: DUF1549 domain-containing protein [Verrucomicrobia bacterium]|nr:DUF1549 domain-containing protein [Verrucomicrobiota bacterium]
MKRNAGLALVLFATWLPLSQRSPLQAAQPRSFNFENDISPLLNRFGCNASSCHGKAEGQNGFKLSVFGYDPAADHKALTMESRGRRVFPAAPEQSLLLQKMSGAMPHGGGTRILPGTAEYEIVRDWIAAGAPFGQTSDPKVKEIEVNPTERVLSMKARQPLRVTAIYSDDRRADVTHLAQFQSNNEVVARVDEEGLISVADVPGQAAIMARYLSSVAVSQILVPRAETLGPFPTLPEFNFIDRLVDQKLKKLNIRPSELSEDAEFLRRVYLDIIGTLPTPTEARRFLMNPRVDRRARLVNELLERPEYADYWALKWADVLRVDRQVLGHKDAYAYYRWIRERIASNTPFDKMVRELITAEGPIDETPPANFYKLFSKPGEMASTLSQVFLGVRIACAECHHHPFDRWSQSDYYGMQAFFQPVSRKKGPVGEMLLVTGQPEARNPRTGEMIRPHPLGGVTPPTDTNADLRRSLAAWFTAAENPWFARNLANRLVAHFLGRGLVEPVDDLRATNPPSNPELLDALARHAVEAQFDVKSLIRTIAASRTYQLASHPNETNEPDEQNYSRALFKRQPAEVLLDAVCQTTGTGEKFPGVPAGYRAIQVWDSDVSHYFLKLFGRPVRKTACECERNAEASIAQVLHLLNSPQVHAKLTHEQGSVARLTGLNPDNGKLTEELYLTFYSRFPTAKERRSAEKYLTESGSDRRHAAEDLAWSMLNSIEFVFNH